MDVSIKQFLAILFLFLIGIILLLQWPGRAGGTNRTVHAPRSAKRSSAPVAPAATGSVTSKTPRGTKPKHTREEPSYPPDALRNFYLPDVSGKNRSFEEALELLLDRYAQAATRTGEPFFDFEFTYRGVPDEPFSFDIRHVRFWDAVDHLAAMAGMQLISRENPILFAEIDDDDTAVTRSWKVGPPLMEEIDNLVLGHYTDGSDGRSRLEAFLRERGLLNNDATDADWFSGNEELTVRSNRRDSERVASYLKLHDHSHHILQVETTVWELFNGAEMPTGEFSRDELNEILTMQVEGEDRTRVWRGNTQLDPDDTKFINLPGSGGPRQFALSGQRYGFGSSVSIHPAMVFNLGTAHVDGVAQLLEHSVVTSQIPGQDAPLAPGQTRIVKHHDQDGRNLYILLTPKHINFGTRQ